MTALQAQKEWFSKHKEQITQDFFTFLRFPSISTDPAFKSDMQACAKWLQEYIGANTNCKAELVETAGYPLVYAEDLSAGKEAPTVLVYGHYDVQPVDPLDLWKSKPFEPTLRDGKVFARGAVDDKGQIFYAVTALKMWKELGTKLNVNLKFCIEGEEESASVGLSKSMSHLKDRLKADHLLVIDFDQFDEETPAISLGARGLAAFEVILTGSNSDLHSGLHGGMAYNPNRALAELLAKVWDENGRIRIEGFYDDVDVLSESQKQEFSFRYDRKSYSEEFGIDAIGSEKGKTLAECNGLSPTFEINGMIGGYTGAGLKTVIPAQAIAKISCRLVPKQIPEKIAKCVTQFLKDNVVKGMKIEVKYLGGEEAFRGNANSDLAKALEKGAQEVTGKPCRKVVSGGSIPIISSMQKVLGAEVVGMGYGLATDNIHAPNEHFDMVRFEKGFLTFARALELV